jgi:hypothetical protein
MPTSPEQAAAEQNIHDMLEAGNTDTLTAYADYAAGEVDDKHVSNLLFAVLLADDRRWQNILAVMGALEPELASAFDKLENELSRLRAHFTETEACNLLRQAELSNEVAAVKAYGKDDPL